MVFNKEKWTAIQKLQKGRHVTSYIHKPLEDLIVYLLYDTNVSADVISIITYATATIVAWFFYMGFYLRAIILAYFVGVLDGVDGKIARLRGKPTIIGKMEHVFDTMYEYLWYITLIVSLSSSFGKDILLFGMTWIALDALVKQTYNIFWLMTGKPLRVCGAAGRIITKIDSRRSMYMIHIFVWLLLGNIVNSIYTIIAHQVFTLVSYIILSFKYKTMAN